MTVAYSTPADAVLVAIDITKVRNEVLIEATGQKRRRRLSVLNSRTEHDRLIDVLRAYGLSVVCGFEATGNYHRLIAWRLAEAGFEVRLVSSLALARTREALHNSWDKNDPKDAQVILHMLRIQATQVYHDPLRAGINDVQELSKTHEAIAKAKTEIQHRILTHYLPLYFPEIERFRGRPSGPLRRHRRGSLQALGKGTAADLRKIEAGRGDPLRHVQAGCPRALPDRRPRRDRLRYRRAGN
jgi:transposase